MRVLLAIALALALAAGAHAAAPALHPVVSARLTSTAAVPKGPPHASGTVVISLSTKKGRACWTITLKGIGKPLSAHIRKAPPGKIGPVIIPLGGRFTSKGCVRLPRKTILAVAAKPSAYYVDVTTRKYLNGAVRGQLQAGA